MSRLVRRARYLFRRAAADREMVEEMRLHLELEIEHRIRRGLTPAEARRTALADFGGLEHFREEARTARGVRPLEDFAQDASYAMRVLRKSPGFMFATVLTLAIGIAATTAVFSVVNAILFRPPPVPEPSRLFVLAEVWKNGQQSVKTDMAQPAYPYPHYLELRETSGMVFSGLAGYRYGNSSVRVRNEARALGSISTSANYFQVLGIRPALGRLFSDTGERFGSPEPEVVISYDLWQSEFAGDSTVVGATLFVNSRELTIVGVAPQGFVGTMIGLVADLWVPAANARVPAELRPGEDVSLRAGWVTMFGRLRPGVTVQQALTTLGVIGRRLRPDAEWQQIDRMALDPMIGPPAMARGPVIGFMGMLFITAALVLLIAAGNIAGMLLARATHRRREIALRLALGASRGRLVRQLVTESVVLCLLGGAAGVLVARWLVSLIPALQPPIGIRTSFDPRIDGLVLAISLGVAVATGMFTGLTPALQSTRFDLLSALRGADGGKPKRHGRSRTGFVVAQLAMSLVLLITAGLFTRALQNALDVDPGLDARNVVVAEVDLASHGYDRTRGETFYAQLMARLAARRELASAALGQWTPLSLSHNGQGVALPDGNLVHVTWGVAGAGYLETMRIPIVAGRTFSATDMPGSAPSVIVNETLARRLWPGQSPLGQQLALNGVREVVGVVRDGKYRNLDEPPTAFAFIPFAQRFSSRMTIHARARDDDGAALAAIRTEVAALDPNIALESTGPFSARLEIFSLPQRVAAWVIGVFGLVGLGLAALGIYGVIAYRVAQRTREFGIRLALGARKADVVKTVLRQGVVVTGAGIAIGVPVALAVAQLTRRFLYGIAAADPITFATLPLLLGAVALLASYIPARRAAIVDPMITLRAE